MWLKKLAVILILIGLLGLFASYFWNYLPGEVRDLVLQGTLEGLPEANENVSSTLSQFSPNMRFNHNDLTYSFISQCSDDKKSKMQMAFLEISESVGVLSFEEVDSMEADILISCSKDRIEQQGSMFISGEGGPSRYLNFSLYSLILQGEIILYEDLYRNRIESCDKPIVEIHELLHVLGYNHVNNKSSILYPYFSCEQVLDQIFIDDIALLYSSPPRAELFFEDASAIKSGPYLDFNISVVNQGLIDSNNVMLEVYGDRNKIEDFELNGIGVGVIKSFSIENLRISRLISEIEFRIVGDVQEYDLNNNVAKLNIG